MSDNIRELIEPRLETVLGEIAQQADVGDAYAASAFPFGEEMSQIREFIDVGEHGLAYESLVATIETHPFVLSGRAAVRLLEAALLLGYKTDRPEDGRFDNRTKQRR